MVANERKKGRGTRDKTKPALLLTTRQKALLSTGLDAHYVKLLEEKKCE